MNFFTGRADQLAYQNGQDFEKGHIEILKDIKKLIDEYESKMIDEELEEAKRLGYGIRETDSSSDLDFDLISFETGNNEE